MTAHTRVRAPGLWVPGSTILQSELEQLDDNAANSISTTGGTYAPAGVIAIGGAGLNVTGAFNASNMQTLALNGTLTGVGGSAINSSGTVTLSGTTALSGTLNVNATTLLAGVNTISGPTNHTGTTAFNNTATFFVTPKLNGSVQLESVSPRTYTRAAKSVIEVDTAKWARATGESASFPMVALEAAFITPNSVPDMIGYVLDVPNGATITTVEVSVEGAAPAHLPTDRPTIYLHKMNLATGVQTLIGSAVDLSALGSDYITLHDITLSGLSEVVNAEENLYIVRVEGEGSTGGVLGLRVCAPRVTFTRSAIGEE